MHLKLVKLVDAIKNGNREDEHEHLLYLTIDQAKECLDLKEKDVAKVIQKGVNKGSLVIIPRYGELRICYTLIRMLPLEGPNEL